jgi:hypothetical protein
MALFYRHYVDGNLSRRELEANIFKHVLGSPNGCYGLVFNNQGDRIDFLCWFYPALRRAVDRYDSRFASFDAYIAVTLRYSFRYYKRHKWRRSVMEIDCWNASNDESYVCEPEISYEAGDGVHMDCSSDSQKHILLVLLKSFYYVSDSLVDKAAAAIGMSPEVLGGMVDMLRNLQIKKIEKLQKLSGTAHCLYYRCLNYEKKLSEKSENMNFNRLISRRLDKGRRRLENIRKRLKAMRIEATNSELSEVMGIPKGTIDSRWALIKNKQKLTRVKPQLQRKGSSHKENLKALFSY